MYMFCISLFVYEVTDLIRYFPFPVTIQTSPNGLSQRQLLTYMMYLFPSTLEHYIISHDTFQYVLRM
jgi:hypothetical protein